jgi:hypothetical protein
VPSAKRMKDRRKEGCSRRAAALPATKKEGAQSKAVDGYHLDKKRVGYLGREQQ